MMPKQEACKGKKRNTWCKLFCLEVTNSFHSRRLLPRIRFPFLFCGSSMLAPAATNSLTAASSGLHAPPPPVCDLDIQILVIPGAFSIQGIGHRQSDILHASDDKAWPGWGMCSNTPWRHHFGSCRLQEIIIIVVLILMMSCLPGSPNSPNPKPNNNNKD